jgi:predicted methyltransferase
MQKKCEIRWSNRYIFSYIEGPLFTKDLLNDLLNKFVKNERRIYTTFDLGLSYVFIDIDDRGYFIYNNKIFSLKDLLNIVEENFVYKYINDKIVRIDLYSDNNYYKLKPVGFDKAPTLEINGIQMHRTVEIDPWTDSYLKIKTLGSLRNKIVLDICTGLGYTAINALRRGAREVISIEKDKNVLDIASLNSWSKDLDKINILLGDALEVVSQFDDECFDVIIHDPPRFNVAGELYSLEFYKELHRILRRGGRIFHYTGEPGRHSNIDILKGVKNRLLKAGFSEIRWINYAKGFLVLK